MDWYVVFVAEAQFTNVKIGMNIPSIYSQRGHFTCHMEKVDWNMNGVGTIRTLNHQIV